MAPHQQLYGDQRPTSMAIGKTEDTIPPRRWTTSRARDARGTQHSVENLPAALSTTPYLAAPDRRQTSQH